MKRGLGLVRFAIVVVCTVSGCSHSAHTNRLNENAQRESRTTMRLGESGERMNEQGLATVGSVDLGKRIIALNPLNRTMGNYNVSDNVGNLEGLRVGDPVKVQYRQAVVFEVRQPTEEELARDGAKFDARAISVAGAVGALQRTGVRVVTIDSINKSRKQMTVHNAEGQVATVEAKYRASLKQAKPGDTAVITAAETIVGEIERID